MEREDSVAETARQLLFRAQLDELLVQIEAKYPALADRIGSMIVRHCTRCGAPIVVGPACDFRAKDCGGHEG